MIKSKILIVDDSLIVRILLTKMLQKNGFEVVDATSGAEAIEFTEKQDFDCMILDLHMDDLNGFEVLQHLHDKLKELPVIVLSADFQDSSRRKVFELGAQVFLNKPPQETDLIEAMHDVLNK